MMKLVKIVISVLIFCIGVSLLFYESRIYQTSLKLVRELIKQDVIYQQHNIVDRETITYAELIATLLQPLEYDIMIDGILIKKEEHDRSQITAYPIRQTQYSKSYRYNDNGIITIIVYSSTNVIG